MIKILNRNGEVLMEIDLLYLSAADLRGAKLSGADLRCADLRGAKLSDADLRCADLRGAKLSDADLRGAKLSDADLRCADLRGAKLSCADLRGAKLSGADLRGADLRAADLRCADLRGAKLSGADLRGADLRGADLRGADLIIITWSAGWTTYITTGHICIGCQSHTLAKWREFSEDEISEMDPQAVDFWKLNKELIIGLCQRFEKKSGSRQGWEYK